MTNLSDWAIGPDGIAKAEPPLTNRGWLLALADAFQPVVARAFQVAVVRVRSQMTVDQIVAAIQGGDIETALRVLNVDQTFAHAFQGVSLPPRMPSVVTSLGELYGAAGVEAVAQLPREAGLRMRFDLLNPRAVDHLRRYDFDLVQQLSRTSVDGLRSIMVRAFEEGMPPRVAAREIRAVVGLTRNMEQAVASRKAELKAEGRKSDQVERMTEKYRQKLLNYRGLNIARTETVRAANEGTLEQERQMQDVGLLGQDAARFWVVTKDDRLCAVCQAIPGLNPQGRNMNQPFITQTGTVMSPPAHPSCRCTFRTVSGFAASMGLLKPQGEL